MGIVVSQSYKNIIIISIALVIGGVNTLYFYPVFLKAEYYGLVVFLLATSNLLQPLISFGSQHTIIKYFSSFNTKKEKDIFMSSIIFLPLITIIPITFLVVEFHDIIASFLSIENPKNDDVLFVTVNGNRRITLTEISDREVRARFTDLSVEKKLKK